MFNIANFDQLLSAASNVVPFDVIDSKLATVAAEGLDTATPLLNSLSNIAADLDELPPEDVQHLANTLDQYLYDIDPETQERTPRLYIVLPEGDIMNKQDVLDALSIQVEFPEGPTSALTSRNQALIQWNNRYWFTEDLVEFIDRVGFSSGPHGYPLVEADSELHLISPIGDLSVNIRLDRLFPNNDLINRMYFGEVWMRYLNGEVDLNVVSNEDFWSIISMGKCSPWLWTGDLTQWGITTVGGRFGYALDEFLDAFKQTLMEAFDFQAVVDAIKITCGDVVKALEFVKDKVYDVHSKAVTALERAIAIFNQTRDRGLSIKTLLRFLMDFSVSLDETELSASFSSPADHTEDAWGAWFANGGLFRSGGGVQLIWNAATSIVTAIAPSIGLAVKGLSDAFVTGFNQITSAIGSTESLFTYNTLHSLPVAPIYTVNYSFASEAYSFMATDYGALFRIGKRIVSRPFAYALCPGQLSIFNFSEIELPAESIPEVKLVNLLALAFDDKNVQAMDSGAGYTYDRTGGSADLAYLAGHNLAVRKMMVKYRSTVQLDSTVVGEHDGYQLRSKNVKFFLDDVTSYPFCQANLLYITGATGSILSNISVSVSRCLKQALKYSSYMTQEYWKMPSGSVTQLPLSADPLSLLVFFPMLASEELAKTFGYYSISFSGLQWDPITTDEALQMCDGIAIAALSAVVAAAAVIVVTSVKANMKKKAKLAAAKANAAQLELNKVAGNPSSTKAELKTALKASMKADRKSSRLSKWLTSSKSLSDLRSEAQSSEASTQSCGCTQSIYSKVTGVIWTD